MKTSVMIITGAVVLSCVLAVVTAHAAYSQQPVAPGLDTVNTISAMGSTMDRTMGSAAGAASTPTCAPSWAGVSSPNAGTMGNILYGVDSASANDVWAVGSYIAAGTLGKSHQRRPSPQKSELLPAKSTPGSSEQAAIARTLIEHWNGSAWTIASSPNVGSDSNSLFMVDAISGNDVWAAGYQINDLGIAQTLIEHWNGTQWSVVPSPNAGQLLDNQLTSVQGLSSSDVWAVGYYYNAEGWQQTLTLHWDGSRWSIVQSPNLGEFDNALYDVAVVSSSDVWAVGTYLTTAHVNRTLTLHWNGSAWNIVSSPPIGSGDNFLYSVDAVASNDVWAVGVLRSSASGGTRVLTQHWDGTQWTVVAGPGEATQSLLYSVDAISANDVWAVGSLRGYSVQALTIHWDGTRWSVVRSPSGGEYGYLSLYSVAAIARDDVWAVGSQDSSSGTVTLVQHYSTACVTCALRYADVPEGSTFFDAVLCLACQGVVSGYAPPPAPPPSPVPTGPPYPTIAPTATPGSPTFRPNANVTRGQFAKIISNSSFYTDDPGAPVFQDVSPDSPFYVWVNRLAHRSILGGYPCGSIPDEPCISPSNLPYFHPGAEATRGQIAKIVSNSANYTEPHTEQNFADVTTSHPFYIWIARLSSRGIIGGYQCGSTPQEPCGPGNRPYFRPSASGTRGQMSKMVSKAFFPNCYTPAR